MLPTRARTPLTLGKPGLGVHYIPLPITQEGERRLCGVDIDNTRFYQPLAKTQAFLGASQPAPGGFAQLYRELAKNDPDILSIHISSGLSGTINSARLGAEAVSEANVTLLDTRTLSCPACRQVESAAKPLRAGWDLPVFRGLLERIRQNAMRMFTLADLKYLVHGGRISHLKELQCMAESLPFSLETARARAMIWSHRTNYLAPNGG